MSEPTTIEQAIAERDAANRQALSTIREYEAVRKANRELIDLVGRLFSTVRRLESELSEERARLVYEEWDQESHPFG